MVSSTNEGEKRKLKVKRGLDIDSLKEILREDPADYKAAWDALKDHINSPEPFAPVSCPSVSV